MGRAVEPPTRRAVAMAVIANPYAGRFSDNLGLADDHRRGTRRTAGGQVRGGARHQAEQAQSYGKAAIVGEGGELEHAAALLHPKMGATLRQAVSRGAALVPSAKKMGGLGAAIDVPLGHKEAAFVRSHFDAIEARVSDAPRANEIVVAIAVTDSGRPLASGRRTASARNQGPGRTALMAARPNRRVRAKSSSVTSA
jgi:hypothetical protein